MNTIVATCMSPLILADKLIGLAQEADRAGYAQCDEQLLDAAFAVLDDHVSEQVTVAGRDAYGASRLQADGRLN